MYKYFRFCLPCLFTRKRVIFLALSPYFGSPERKAADEARRKQAEKEKALNDTVAKLEDQVRQNRAKLMGIDTQSRPNAIIKDLLDPLLEGTIPVKGTHINNLFAEVLRKNADRGFEVTKILENIIHKFVRSRSVSRHQTGSQIIDDCNIYSALVSVNNDNVVCYRVIYDGYNHDEYVDTDHSDNDSDGDVPHITKNFLYFDINMYGSVLYDIHRGSYLKGHIDFEKQGWFTFY